jgi:hypothetical protein
LPDDDDDDDGWVITGGAGSLWATLNNDDDGKYVSCPGHKGKAQISFPIDIDTSAIPTGALITSITVYVRAAKGAGTPPSNTPASITVLTAALDDRSKFVLRTIYPSSTIATYEVATYSRDVLGKTWDVHRINQLLSAIFCYVGVADVVRCYKLYVNINYRDRPTITTTGPTGTAYTPSPTVTWTYRQTDGDPQSFAEYQIFTGVQHSSSSFNPSKTVPVFYGTVPGAVNSVVLPTSLNNDTYFVYVRGTSSFGVPSAWAGRQFSISGPAPNPPGVPTPGGNPGDSEIQVVGDSFAGVAALTMRDSSNLLSVQIADAETSTDGAEWTTSNCTVARVTSPTYSGGQGAWQITASGSGGMSLTTSWIDSDEGIPVTARAQFRTASTARACRVDLAFYDDSFTQIGSTTTGTTVNDASGTYTEVVSNAVTSPTNTAYIKASFVVTSAAGSEVHYLDHLGVMYGTGTPWSDGGHMSRNLLSAWYSNAEGSAPSGQSWIGASGSTTGTAGPGGTGASGSTAHKMTYAGISPTLGFRAAGTVFTTPTTGTNFTLNKPAGVATGDLMVAYVLSSEFSSITPPAGWTLVDTASVDDGSNDCCLFVLKRTAGGSEPSTWTDGTVSVSSARRVAAVIAYSGAADVSSQFLAEGQSSTPALANYLTTPSVTNTDPNAWRISAFGVDDSTTPGSLTANTSPPSGAVQPIAFVSAAAPWKYASTTAPGYTINKPSGVISGDLLLATVSCVVSVGTTITAPTGWTIANQTSRVNGEDGITSAVLYRVAGGSEPTSWTDGSMSGGTLGKARVTQCSAYRNVSTSTPILASSIGSSATSTTMTTPSVTNTNSTAWRVCAFGGQAHLANHNWNGGDTSERSDAFSADSGGEGSIALSMSDSNGPVSTGSYTRSSSFESGNSFYAGTGWMGFLNPLPSAPAAPGNETSRASGSIGSSSPYLALAAFDSAGPVAARAWSVSGIYSQNFQSAAAWVGIVTPASPTVSGQVSAKMATTVDISKVDPSVLSLAGGKVAVTASFLGSSAGTPFMGVGFYRANTLIDTYTTQGNSFGTSAWTVSSAVLDMPSGTTRMDLTFSVGDRAVNDNVFYDRVSLALGGDTVYRPGTSRPAHPVWSYPEVQYAQDTGSGYGGWLPLPGATLANPAAFDPLTGLSLYDDHTAVPLVNRKYRARTVSLGLLGDRFVSDWGPDSLEFSFSAENWWLKDVANPANNLRLRVKYDDVLIDTTNTSVVYQPLGQDYPVVLTEGFKGETFTLKMIPVDKDSFSQLLSMLKSNRTLFLQSDIDRAWWVRATSAVKSDLLPTSSRQSNPLREIEVAFTEVQPEV